MKFIDPHSLRPPDTAHFRVSYPDCAPDICIARDHTNNGLLGPLAGRLHCQDEGEDSVRSDDIFLSEDVGELLKGQHRGLRPSCRSHLKLRWTGYATSKGGHILDSTSRKGTRVLPYAVLLQVMETIDINLLSLHYPDVACFHAFHQYSAGSKTVIGRRQRLPQHYPAVFF